MLSGVYRAAPPNVPPPRQSAANPPGVPQGHPPVEVPDEVRKVIAKLADLAKNEDLSRYIL